MIVQLGKNNTRLIRMLISDMPDDADVVKTGLEYARGLPRRFGNIWAIAAIRTTALSNNRVIVTIFKKPA